jgi:predicted NUDIX family NTP pyrophosphohydrolase
MWHADEERLRYQLSLVLASAMEWPPGSGRQQTFPEVDRGEWFDLRTAETKILAGQLPFLTQVKHMLTEGMLGEARSSG